MLNISDAALRLGVSTDTVDRWVRQGKVPAQKEGGRWLFSAAELQRWARANGLPFSTDLGRDRHPKTIESVTVSEALRQGGIYRAIETSTVREVLQSLADRAPIPPEHREELVNRLEQREALSSTGIGHGIAVPHPRNPLQGIITQPSITCCCLETPVDFGAIDGDPVSVSLLLLSPNVEAHLPLLSRLAFCLSDPVVTSLLADGCPVADDLLTAVTRVETKIGR